MKQTWLFSSVKYNARLLVKQRPSILLIKVCRILNMCEKCWKKGENRTKLTFLKVKYLTICVDFECRLFYMFYRLYMGLHLTAGISWLCQKLSLLWALKVNWTRQFFDTMVKDFQDDTGQTVWCFGENEDAGVVSRGNHAENDCGEAPAKR